MKKQKRKSQPENTAGQATVDEDDELDMKLGGISPALPCFVKEGYRAAHRMEMLRSYAPFKKDYKTLTKLGGSIVRGHIDPDGALDLNSAARRRFDLLVRTFEGKWRVLAIPKGEAQEGELNGFLVWDRHHPTPPFVLNRAAVVTAIDLAIVEPERYAVIDTTMSPEDIRRYLRRFFPLLRGPGNRAYEIEIQPGQFDQDVQIMRAAPETTEDFRKLAVAFDPRAKQSKVDMNEVVDNIRTRLRNLLELVAPTPGVVFPPANTTSP